MTHALKEEVGSGLITQEHTDLIMQVSKAVGRKYSHQYPFLEADDIASEVQAQALAQWRHIGSKLAKVEEHDRTEEEVLHFLLSQRANVYCGKQHYEFMMHSATAIYTPREVRELLKECFYHPDAYTTPSKDTNHGVVVEAQSVLVNLVDLNAALSRVSDSIHDTILAAFGPEDLELPVPDKRRVSDAVAAVTRELNKGLNGTRTNHQGPGARQANANYNSLENVA